MTKKVESKHRKGCESNKVSMVLDVDAWDGVKTIQKKYELKTLSAAIRMLLRLANEEVK